MIKFWLETKKVDGLRIDALKHAFEDESFADEPLIKESDTVSKYDDLDHIYTTNQEETFELLNEWRSFCDDISKRTNSTKFVLTYFRLLRDSINYLK